MGNISSVFRLKNLNPPVDEAKVSRIEPAPADPANPQLSILYFYGADDEGRQKIVRVWFYSSTAMREEELASIQLNYPYLSIT